MKIDIKIFFGAMLSIPFFLASCSKEDIGNESINSTIHQINVYSKTTILSEYAFFSPLAPISSLILNPNDPDDEKLNIYNHMLSLAFQEIACLDSFQNDVLSMIEPEIAEDFCIQDFFDMYPHHFNDIDIFLNANFGLDFNTIANDYTYHGDQYFPAINLPNLDNFDYRLNPVLAIGCDVDDFDDITHEAIPAYYPNEDCIYSEMLLGKAEEELGVEDALSKDPVNLILVFTHKEFCSEVESYKTKHESDMNKTFLTGRAYDPLNPCEKAEAYYIKKAKISNRWDRSRRSEFKLKVSPADPFNCGAANGQGIYFNPPRVHLRKVHKNDIGKIMSFALKNHYIMHSTCNTPYNQSGPIADKTVFGFTYEYDWWASGKFYDFINNSGNQITILFKAKYSDEVYHEFYENPFSWCLNSEKRYDEDRGTGYLDIHGLKKE